MTNYKLPLSFDDYGQDEIKAITKSFRSKKYTMGNSVQLFENKISKWLGVKNAIMVNSGSSANLLLITSLLYRSFISKNLLKPGDEVLVPALAWSTTVWPIVQLGLIPVFVDIDINTLAIDIKSAKKMISKKTKAVFLIHVLGQACKMNDFVNFCKKNNLFLIEDCCESFGAFYKKKSIGTFGYGGSFSHYFSHHLTTIEGGTVITNNDDLADDIRSLRAHGWIRDRHNKQKFLTKSDIDKRFLFILPGYNVRPMEMQAVIGIEQLKNINKKLNERDRVVKKLYLAFNKGPSWLKIIGSDFIKKNIVSNKKENRSHSWMNLPIILTSKKYKIAKVIKIFEDEGVETRPIISGNILKHPAFKKIKHKKHIDLSNTNFIHKNGFMIGCHPKLENKSFKAINRVMERLIKLSS